MPTLSKKKQLLFQIRPHVCKLATGGGRHTQLPPATAATGSQCGFLPPKHTDSANLGPDTGLAAAPKRRGRPRLSSSRAGTQQKPLVSE